MRHPIITSTIGAAVILVVAAAVLWAMPVHAEQCGKAPGTARRTKAG
jgi:hypothetical protein